MAVMKTTTVNVQAIGEAYASFQRDYPHDDWNELMIAAWVKVEGREPRFPCDVEEGLATEEEMHADGEAIDAAFAVADSLARSRATGEEWLTLQFGRHQGLNADWSVRAWRVCGQLWIVDNEDGTFSFAKRSPAADGGWNVEIHGEVTL